MKGKSELEEFEENSEEEDEEYVPSGVFLRCVVSLQVTYLF